MTFDPMRLGAPNSPRPAPSEDESRPEEPVPTAEARSSLQENRAQLTPRAARRCCHPQAVHTVDRPPGHAAPRVIAGSGGREATITFTIPRVALVPENHLAMAP